MYVVVGQRDIHNFAYPQRHTFIPTPLPLSMPIHVSCLETGANIRGVRESGVAMLKNNIRTGGYNTISVIAVYEESAAPALAVAGNAPKPIRELVKDDETPPHQRWVREEMETTRRYIKLLSRVALVPESCTGGSSG